ncbi:acyl-CoA dehydrogenase family protein [Xanthobacter aminoxidans]|uniref:acyl-CoA dehydrogenase family protein n=1 Tax=Xanthobacter aminoxidans TaxID=186280 RepID=UPI00202316F2|nr:acyl-CoA dehydrogenase family protein [Xanthobacter aminoxidans]
MNRLEEISASVVVHRSELADAEFRAAWRAWLEEHCDVQMLRPARRLAGAPLKAWLRKLNVHGWRAPGWPREHGGMGLSFAKQLIYREELERLGVTRWLDLGETLLGPMLMRHGTQEQKATLLPRILDCSDFWCQGYSEPNAGSDLASLRTTAVRDGDDFIVNGQKIWTTFVQDATHIFTLVRTGRYERRQQGISFLLIDIETPGITRRGIRNIAGDSEFGEVFFDDVRVPSSQLLGTLDEGWTIAKSLLEFERTSIGSPFLADLALKMLNSLAERCGIADDPVFAARMKGFASELDVARLLYADLCGRFVSGEKLDSEFSMMKLVSTELFQRTAEYAVEVLTPYQAGHHDQPTRVLFEELNHLYLISRPVTIFGGTSEVQRDIISRSLLAV